jgi:TPR repeat protein
LGVPPAQQAEAEQLWQQADALMDRNQNRAAARVLLKAANMGHKRAQAMLGIMFQDGTGVKADDRAAAYWFSAAAAQGHRAAQYALAGMYFDGDGGLPKDPAKATELLIKSANQGFGQAQYAIAFQYEVGEGVPRNRQKAIALFRASGDGEWIAEVLANPRTPTRIASEVAFGDYLAAQRNAEFSASWARARATMPSGGGGNPFNTMTTIEHGNWVRAGGNDNPHNPYRQ